MDALKGHLFFTTPQVDPTIILSFGSSLELNIVYTPGTKFIRLNKEEMVQLRMYQAKLGAIAKVFRNAPRYSNPGIPLENAACK